ncbi:MAG: hypothetical protein ACRENY_02365 [Candidatus Dormibacteria bacterium]
MRQFADLHGRSDVAVVKFASRHGWLRSRWPDAADPDPTAGPLRADRLSDWRRESADVAELIGLAEDAERLRRHGSEEDRRRVLEHFQAYGETLWLGPPGESVPGRVAPAQGLRRVPLEEVFWKAPEGANYSHALAFTWRSRHATMYLPYPGPGQPTFRVAGRGAGAPTWGSDLTLAHGRALSELAMFAVGCMTEWVLVSETHTTLTLRRGIRAAPSSLVGAVYLGLARELLFAHVEEDRVCPACGERFTANRRNARWCSEPCRSRGQRLGLSAPGSAAVRAAAASRRKRLAGEPR